MGLVDRFSDGLVPLRKKDWGIRGGALSGCCVWLSERGGQWLVGVPEPVRAGLRLPSPQ